MAKENEPIIPDNWSKSPAAYRKYMINIKSVIEETEKRMLNLDKMKKVSEFNYDEWVKWLKGEIKLD